MDSHVRDQLSRQRTFYRKQELTTRECRRARPVHTRRVRSIQDHPLLSPADIRKLDGENIHILYLQEKSCCDQCHAKVYMVRVLKPPLATKIRPCGSQTDGGQNVKKGQFDVTSSFVCAAYSRRAHICHTPQLVVLFHHFIDLNMASLFTWFHRGRGQCHMTSFP